MLLRNAPDSKYGKSQKWLSIVYFKSMSWYSIGIWWCLCLFWQLLACVCFPRWVCNLCCCSISGCCSNSLRLDICIWDTQQDFSKMNQQILERTFLQNQNQEKAPCITRVNVLWHLGNAQIGLKWRAKSSTDKDPYTHMIPSIKSIFPLLFYSL